MFLLELNWLAILVAFVVAFLAGALWFGPKTFFPVWWKAIVPQSEPLHHVGLAAGPVGPLGGLLTGLLLGIGFAAASSLSHRLFAGHGLKVWIIEVGSDVLNYTLVGLVIGLFG